MTSPILLLLLLSRRGVLVLSETGDGQLAKVRQPRRQAADGSVDRSADVSAGEGAPQHHPHHLPHRHGGHHPM